MRTQIALGDFIGDRHCVIGLAADLPRDRARDHDTRSNTDHAGREHQREADHHRALAALARLGDSARIPRDDLLADMVEQLGRRAVHAFDRSVAGHRIETRRLEGFEAFAIALAHRRMRLHELLDQRSRLAFGQ